MSERSYGLYPRRLPWAARTLAQVWKESDRNEAVCRDRDAGISLTRIGMQYGLSPYKIRKIIESMSRGGEQE